MGTARGPRSAPLSSGSGLAELRHQANHLHSSTAPETHPKLWEEQTSRGDSAIFGPRSFQVLAKKNAAILEEGRRGHAK